MTPSRRGGAASWAASARCSGSISGSCPGSISTTCSSRQHQVDVHAPDRERDAWAIELVRGTARELHRIDPLITQHATNWRIERMAVVDRVILRLGVYELLCTPDTPPAVVIDEAVELARTFSADQAVPFVNGVLDAVHRGAGRVG